MQGSRFFSQHVITYYQTRIGYHISGEKDKNKKINKKEELSVFFFYSRLYIRTLGPRITDKIIPCSKPQGDKGHLFWTCPLMNQVIIDSL